MTARNYAREEPSPEIGLSANWSKPQAFTMQVNGETCEHLLVEILISL